MDLGLHSRLSVSVHMAAMLYCGDGPDDHDQPRAGGRVGLDGDRVLRVLIVEDEILIAMHLEATVEDMGLEVCGIVATGADALNMAASTQPDLILMDINLRGAMDGIEAARQVCDGSDTRIIFVTAYGDPQTLRRIKAATPHAPVLHKPPRPADLLAAIKRVTEG